PIVYGEYGLETTIAPTKAHLYTGAEPPSTHPIPPALQGREYAQAIRMVACQPRVRYLLFFHVSDESALAGLQTGVYYADDSPKPSLAAVEAADASPVKC